MGYQRPNNQQRRKQYPSYNEYQQRQNNGNNYQNYLTNKRQTYQNMKNGGRRQNNNNFKRFNQKKQQQQRSKDFNFKNRNLNETALDKELDSYHMKNPNVEDRKLTMNGNLDKELDDYWKSQKESEGGEGAKQQSQQQKDAGNG